MGTRTARTRVRIRVGIRVGIRIQVRVEIMVRVRVSSIRRYYAIIYIFRLEVCYSVVRNPNWNPYSNPDSNPYSNTNSGDQLTQWEHTPQRNASPIVPHGQHVTHLIPTVTLTTLSKWARAHSSMPLDNVALNNALLIFAFEHAWYIAAIYKGNIREISSNINHSNETRKK